ncbi:MAG: cysteine hydrolase [Oscillospiraceae bacterium]|nr:cysteine hydrolase [Oscillospiraceae bacterium]
MVIDMQNDYLYEKRKPQFSYDTPQLVAAVNKLIHEYSDAGNDCIYIRHIIQNLPTNRWLFGYSIAGTEGAELYSGLDVVSKYVFDKLFGDALTNRYLLELIRAKGYDKLHLCGLDECGCVTSTALGAAKRGITAEIVSAGTATVFPEQKVIKAHEKLKKAGVRFI